MIKFNSFKKIIFLFSFLSLSSCSTLEAPAYKGPVSDNFNGRHFYNPWLHKELDEKLESEKVRSRRRGFLSFLWRRLTNSRQRGEWPPWIHQSPSKIQSERVFKGTTITFVGHATVLIQTGGLNILTDPVWSHQVGPSRSFSISRYKNPGVYFDDLPEIDAVIVSHNHYDHMDLRTLKKLMKRQKDNSPKFIVPLGNSVFLKKHGITNTQDLDWWQSIQLTKDLKIEAVPAQHWSTRMLHDRNYTLWAGFVIHNKDQKIYFAGDTGYGAFVSDIQKRMGKIDIALLPIGAYLPKAFRKNHIDPWEAVRVHKELQVQTSIPIHYGSFRQSDEAYDQPVNDLRLAMNEEKVLPQSFVILKEGEAWSKP